MKDFIAKVLATYALVVLVANIIAPLLSGGGFLFSHAMLLQAFVMVVAIRTSVLLLQFFGIKFLLIEYSLAYLIVVLQGYFFTWIWEWSWAGLSHMENLLLVFLVSSTVFVLICIFDLARVNQDIAIINKQLARKGKKKEKAP